MVAPDTSDGQLVAHIRRGEPEAFELLFQRHARSVYNFCFRRTANWAVAEDLLSAVFLEAWRKRGDLRPSADGSLRPWLLGVATNLIRNRNRSSERFARALQRLWLRDEPGRYEGEDLGSRLADEKRMAALLELVRRLPRREREVLVLYAWADLAYSEIAVALGLPVGTVRSRLARARSRIGAWLDDSDSNDAPVQSKEAT
jgi:RNA polymerase sigma factor (sigma-70 family)